MFSSLFDDEIQFFDISFDETAKSYAVSIWVYRDGEWVRRRNNGWKH